MIRRPGHCSAAWTRMPGLPRGVCRATRPTRCAMMLRAAIASYADAYRRNPGHYYSGINALTLMHTCTATSRGCALRRGDDHYGRRSALRGRMRTG